MFRDDPVLRLSRVCRIPNLASTVGYARSSLPRLARPATAAVVFAITFCSASCLASGS